MFLYSDNGNYWGEHRLDQGKLAPYKEETNFPLMVRGPGVPQGVVSKKLVGNHDHAPTFADLAGANIPSFVDGRSFARLLDAASSNDEPWRSTSGGPGSKIGERRPRARPPTFLPTKR